MVHITLLAVIVFMRPDQCFCATVQPELIFGEVRMATTEQRETLEGALSSTLSRTIDFLKFAETKNAALLTFASAWLLALASLLASDRLLGSNGTGEC